MSWLTGLAGKAENFLNNLDNSAAQALQKSQEEELGRLSSQTRMAVTASGGRPTYRSEPEIIAPFTGAGTRTRSQQLSAHPTAALPASRFSGQQLRSPVDRDAELFEFLNSSSVTSTPARRPPSSLVEDGGKPHYHDDQRQESRSLPDTDAASSGYQTGVTTNTVNLEATDDLGAVRVVMDTAVEGGRQLPGGGDTDLEVKMLRSEISSLTQEVSSLLQRNHRSDEEAKRLRGQVDKLSGQLREADRRCRELCAGQDDLQEQIRVRESQVEALRTEFAVARETGEESRRRLTNLLAENQSIRTDHCSSKEAQNMVVEELRTKLHRSEDELRTIKDTHRRLELENDNLKRSLEDSKLRQAELATRQESALMDERRRQDSLIAQLEVAKQKHQSLQRELRDYKEKAAKILQMKEKVIASMRDGTGSVSPAESPLATVAERQAEWDCAREERDMLREEVARCRLELERRDCDLIDLEQQMQSERESLRRNIDLLEEQLDRERQLREDSESELAQLRREHQFLEDRAVRAKTEFHDHLAAKEDELTRLRGMLMVKSNYSDSQTEMEARIRVLTENLIQKQSSLDSIKAENHSLQVRLERTEQDLETLERTHIALAASVNSSSSGMGERGMVASGGAGSYIKINMQDPPLTKNVKAAVNTLNAVSIRLGVFLRRYPPARLFFLIYTLFLHLWVVFVLCTYQPEIHQNGVLPPKP